MNRFVEVIKEELTKLKKMLKQTGTDYIAVVTSVEGKTAYVKIAGSDINDTPVSMSINAKPGDTVRVRVKEGKAWITGNDSAPPTDDTNALQAIQDTKAIINQEKKAADGRYSRIEHSVDQIVLEVGEVDAKADAAQITADGRMKADMSNKVSSITIGSGTITFNSNSLVVNSSKFSLDANGNATFGGTLNAAGGSFTGSMGVSANTSQGTIQVTICSRDSQSRVAIPIRISEKYSSQANTEYRTTIGGDGMELQQITSNTDVAHTDLGYGGVTVWASGVGTTSMTPFGVSGPNSSRLISSGEISKLNNYPTSPPDKWNNPVKWSKRTDRYTYNLNAGAYHWYVLTAPTDSNYNWYLINAVGDENAFWILHTSQTGAYVYNHGSDNWASIELSGYWLGIHK